MDAELQALGRRLVGDWTSEATHPLLPGDAIIGSTTFEWLDGEQFLILRSHYEHPEIPDAVSIIGDTDGFHMHYFDSRGVFRLYDVTLIEGGWVLEMARDSSSGSFASTSAPFSQRMTYTLENDDQRISGQGELSHDDVNWDDDLAIIYHRRA